MRKVWATCTAAVFLLSEMDSYFESQVVEEAWQHFRSWITPSSGPGSRPTSARSEAHGEIDTLSTSPRASVLSEKSVGQPQQHAPWDPEALATAQRRFLNAVARGLLLTDTPFAKMLRTLLLHIDELVAYILRLEMIQQNLDLEEDEGIIDAMANNVQEEKEVQLEIDRSRKRVDSDMKAVVERLRKLDANREGWDSDEEQLIGKSEKEQYVPCPRPGVERLLMKLDFARASKDETDGED